MFTYKIYTDMRTKQSFKFWLWLLALLPAFATAQQPTATLSGAVTGAGGESLPGVSIEVKSADGQRKGAASDVNGAFSIPGLAPGSGYTITFSFIGFETHILRY